MLRFIHSCLVGLIALGSATPALSFSFKGKAVKGQIHINGVNNSRKQNFSGTVNVDGKILVIDDAGFPLPSLFFQIDEKNTTIANPWNLTLPINFVDLEGLTWAGGYYYMITSMTNNEPESWSSQWLVRFHYEDYCQCVTEFRSINFRKPMIDALIKAYGKEWGERVSVADAKFGGLNIEGLANSPDDPDTLLIGYRSPLASPTFGSPSVREGFALNHGKAIVAEVKNAFGKEPEVKLTELDLKGLGFRGFEYLPALKKYGIIAGQADVGDRYALWLWDAKTNALEEVDLPELKSLCRPESLVQIGSGKDAKLLIVSENSGKVCEKSEVDTLTIPIGS